MHDCLDIRAVLVDREMHEHFAGSLAATRIVIYLLAIHINKAKVFRFEESLALVCRCTKHAVIGNAHGVVALVAAAISTKPDAVTDVTHLFF